jgi:tetratricopeptide (TPR) repeat protein
MFYAICANGAFWHVTKKNIMQIYLQLKIAYNSGNVQLYANIMKSIIIIGFLFLKFNISFSQIPFGGIEGLKDTSNFPDLRSQLKIQSLAIEFDSTYVAAYFKHAALEYQLGNYEICIGEQNDIIKRFPDYITDAYTNRGMCYCFLKKYDKALADLNKARQLSPENAMSYLNLAFVESSMQEYQLAIFDLDTAITLRPDYAKAFANRAFAKEQLKKYKEANEDYNKALEIEPNYPEVYFNRGYLKFIMNKPDEAIADYNEALAIFPNFSLSYDFYLYRSRAYEKKEI